MVKDILQLVVVFRLWLSNVNELALRGHQFRVVKLFVAVLTLEQLVFRFVLHSRLRL